MCKVSSNTKGFTLMEMVVVLAIIGLSGGFAWSGMHLLQETKFNELTNEVVQLIKDTQQKAALTNGNYTINLVTARGEQAIVLTREASQEAQIVLPKDVQGTLTAPGNSVAFSGDVSPSAATSIYLDHTGLGVKRRISVRVATGKTTVTEE